MRKRSGNTGGGGEPTWPKFAIWAKGSEIDQMTQFGANSFSNFLWGGGGNNPNWSGEGRNSIWVGKCLLGLNSQNWVSAVRENPNKRVPQPFLN